MAANDRYDRFMQASRNLKIFPLLEPQEIEDFRVKYGRRTLARLKQEVQASEANGKVIFTGHRGCGKSTLLYELNILMQKQQHFVVLFSIADMVEMSDVNHVNILCQYSLCHCADAFE